MKKTLSLILGALLGIGVIAGTVYAIPDTQGSYNVQINKTNAAGTQLAGAAFKIVKGTNENGQVVKEFNTTDVAYHVELEAGTYTLVETQAPKGYRIAEPTTFTVTKPAKWTDPTIGNIYRATSTSAYYTWHYDVTYNVTKGVAAPEVVYCVNPNKAAPQSDLEYIKKDGSAEAILQATNPNGVPQDGEELRSKFMSILYNGFPENHLSLQEQYGLRDDAFRMVTQQAIWDTARNVYSNSYRFSYYPQMYAAYQALMSYTDNVPDNMETHMYQIKDYSHYYQSLIGSAFAEKAAALEVTVVDEEKAKKTVALSKVSATGLAELPGAELDIRDAQGNVIDKWTSTTTPHVVTLEEGTYTMHENQAPLGYDVAEDITFRVTENAGLQIKNGDNWVDAADATITMKDELTPVPPGEINAAFSKVAINGTAELPGAELDIRDAQGNVIDKWTSTTTPHVVNLKEGTYTMHENQAPAGYAVAEDITFRVTKDNKLEIKQGNTWVAAENATVVMKDAPLPGKVRLSKVAVNGTGELPGAELEVRDGKGNVVDKWTSTTTPHVIELNAGTYKMHESKAPLGYDLAEDITFRVAADNTVQIKEGNTWVDAADATVTMKDNLTPVPPQKTKALFSKIGINGTAELPGAELEIRDAQGATLDKWTSTTAPHFFELTEGVYSMHENQAPLGYAVAEDITFRITADNKVQIKEGGTWVDAANATVTMKDLLLPPPPKDKIQVEFSKVEVNGTEELPGAELEVRDSKGNVIDKWTSTTEVHRVELEAGTYTMHENQAPLGYEIAEDITFRITVNNTVEVKDEKNAWVPAENARITMKDARTPENTPSPSTPTPTATATTSPSPTRAPVPSPTLPITGGGLVNTGAKTGAFVLSALALLGFGFAAVRRSRTR